jgi:hypothetical protein
LADAPNTIKDLHYYSSIGYSSDPNLLHQPPQDQPQDLTQQPSQGQEAPRVSSSQPPQVSSRPTISAMTAISLGLVDKFDFQFKWMMSLYWVDGLGATRPIWMVMLPTIATIVIFIDQIRQEAIILII